MPIQIQVTGSIAEVEREIRSLEIQYEMSSADFLAHPSVDDVVPEFDAIEWNFLLMQKRALEEDSCSKAAVFPGRYSTQISTVDTSDMYPELAA